MIQITRILYSRVAREYYMLVKGVVGGLKISNDAAGALLNNNPNAVTCKNIHWTVYTFKS